MFELLGLRVVFSSSSTEVLKGSYCTLEISVALNITVKRNTDGERGVKTGVLSASDLLNRAMIVSSCQRQKRLLTYTF